MTQDVSPSEVLPMSAADPRSACNLILDVADEQNKPITHLALQKLLYFSHGIYLSRTGKPLISGYFEAWEHGPVHPAAYSSFKTAGASQITFRGKGHDPVSGQSVELPEVTDPTAVESVRRVVSMYGDMGAGHLRAISHANNGPWWYVVNKARTSTAFGLRIPDEVILERFKYHKVSIKSEHLTNEPTEVTPFT